jgi:hypothetical protein
MMIGARQTCEEHSLEIIERAAYNFIAIWHLNQVVFQNRKAGLLPVRANAVQWVNALAIGFNFLCK